MTKDDCPNNGDTCSCIAYLYNGADSEHVRVSYRFDFDSEELAIGSEDGNASPHRLDYTVVALIDPIAQKDDVVHALKQLLETIEQSGLYLGIWRRAGQDMVMFDEGERILGTPID